MAQERLGTKHSAEALGKGTTTITKLPLHSAPHLNRDEKTHQTDQEVCQMSLKARSHTVQTRDRGQASKNIL